MNVFHYETSSGKDVILEYINSLDVTEQVDAFTVLENMEKGEFDKIFFKKWTKKIYEAYFKKHNRLFFIIHHKENIYILHACRKQKNKTEKTDSNLVKKRAKELGKQLGENFI